jgi:hypothetical protein
MIKEVMDKNAATVAKSKVKTLKEIKNLDLVSGIGNIKDTFPESLVEDALSAANGDIFKKLALATREISVNALDRNGDKVSLVEMNIDGSECVAFLSNSDPFDSSYDIGERFFRPSVSDGAKSSRYGAGGLASSFAIAPTTDRFVIVGTKVNGSFEYCMGLQAGMSYPKVEVTGFIGKKIAKILGTLANEYNNIFIVPMLNKKGTKFCGSGKFSNLLTRLCGDKLSNSLTISLLRGHVLSEKEPFVRSFKKDLTAIVTEEQFGKSFMDNSIDIDPIAVDYATKDFDTGEEIEIKAEVSFNIQAYPDFKSKSRHAVSLVDGNYLTLAGDGEKYDCFTTMRYLSDKVESFGRSDYQPCDCSYTDLYNIAMRMGIPIKNSHRTSGLGFDKTLLNKFNRVGRKAKTTINKSIKKYYPRLVIVPDINIKSVKLNGEAQSDIDSLRIAGGMSSVFTLKDSRIAREIIHIAANRVRTGELLEEEDQEYFKHFFQHDDKDGYYIDKAIFAPSKADRKKIGMFDPSGNLLEISAKDIEKNSFTGIVEFRYIKSGVPDKKPIPLHKIDYLNDLNSGIRFKPVGAGELATIVIDSLKSPDGATEIKVSEYTDGCTPSRSRSIFVDGAKRVVLRIDDLPKSKTAKTATGSGVAPKGSKLDPELSNSYKIGFDSFDESIVGVKSPVDPFCMILNDKNSDMVRIFGQDIPDMGLKKRADKFFYKLAISGRMMEKRCIDSLQLNWSPDATDSIKEAVSTPEGLAYSNGVKVQHDINEIEVKYLATSITKMHKENLIQSITEDETGAKPKKSVANTKTKEDPLGEVLELFDEKELMEKLSS